MKTETLCPTQVTGALSPPLVPHLKKQLTSCTNTPSLWAIQIPIFLWLSEHHSIAFRLACLRFAAGNGNGNA